MSIVLVFSFLIMASLRAAGHEYSRHPEKGVFFILGRQKMKIIKRLKAAELLLERYKFSKPTISVEERTAILIDCVAVLIGEYEIHRKYAALILIKYLLPVDIVKTILNDERIYPFDRNDPRVRKWIKAVTSQGYCEKCGATEQLEAHHIIKWADYPKGRIDINNGMCLCHNCHTEQHEGDQSYHMMKAKCGEKM